jgi:hypothetical protein
MFCHELKILLFFIQQSIAFVNIIFNEFNADF